MSRHSKIILFLIGGFVVGVVILALQSLSKDDETVLVAVQPDSRPENPFPSPPKNAKFYDFFKISKGSTGSPILSGSGKIHPSHKINKGDFPESITDTLGITEEMILQHRDKFKKTVVHVEWMDRVNDVLKNLDPTKKQKIIQNHATLLYIKDMLDKAYLTGKIDFETFKNGLAELMKWHQASYLSILTQSEFEALFDLTPTEAEQYVDSITESIPEYSFILNQQLPTEEITTQVQKYTLDEVNSSFKQMAMERDDIGRLISSGKMTLEQAREALNKSQQAFIDRCKEILTETEIDLIFGSMENLESGAAKTKPPAILGQTDEEELGFEVENPHTTIEQVKQSLEKNSIDDIRFFYEQRKQERDQLISRLDGGEITEKEMETISREMDAAYEENCREILTDAEFKLLFDESGKNTFDDTNSEVTETNLKQQ